MTNVEHSNNVSLDRKEDSIKVRLPPVQKLSHLKGKLMILGGASRPGTGPQVWCAPPSRPGSPAGRQRRPRDNPAAPNRRTPLTPRRELRPCLGHAGVRAPR